jgi:hypothetical protein
MTGQQICEKMLNILGHKGNANQNDIEILPPLYSKWLSSITQTTTNAGENVGGKEHFYTVGGNVNYCNRYGK